jgi:hypothetical protein
MATDSKHARAAAKILVVKSFVGIFMFMANLNVRSGLD